MSSIDTRQKLIYGDGALQKASLTYKNAQTGREVTLPVQFNPTEYSISRGLRFKNNGRTWGRIPSGKHTGGRQ